MWLCEGVELGWGGAGLREGQDLTQTKALGSAAGAPQRERERE